MSGYKRIKYDYVNSVSSKRRDIRELSTIMLIL